MTKICIALSRKRPGPVAYSSDSIHVSAELDLPVRSAEEFRSQVAQLHREVAAALAAELSCSRDNGHARCDLWSGHNGSDPQAPRTNGSSTGDRPLTARQEQYLHELAARQWRTSGEDLQVFLRSVCEIDKPLEELTRAEASRAIDALSQGGSRP